MYREQYGEYAYWWRVRVKTLPLLLVGAMLMFVYPDIQLNLKSTLPKNQSENKARHLQCNYASRCKNFIKSITKVSNMISDLIQALMGQHIDNTCEKCIADRKENWYVILGKKGLSWPLTPKIWLSSLPFSYLTFPCKSAMRIWFQIKMISSSLSPSLDNVCLNIIMRLCMFK